MNGILVVNKEKNMTSRDVINKLNHIFNTRAIGHTGTLDPIATGVLICLIGKYTKLSNDITSSYKEYVAEMELGIKTDTYDNTGNIIEKKENSKSEEEMKKVINSFKCKYEQEVPIYSSVKINGKKLYEYARNNEMVILPKRLVDIKEIEILSINNNIVKFRCLVSKGTYIRSLINDIGNTLGCGAIMISLERTMQSGINIKNAYTLEEIKNNNYKLLNLEDVLDLEIINCNLKSLKEISNGVKQKSEILKNYILYKYNNELVALYKRDDDVYKMYIKF